MHYVEFLGKASRECVQTAVNIHCLSTLMHSTGWFGDLSLAALYLTPPGDIQPNLPTHL